MRGSVGVQRLQIELQIVFATIRKGNLRVPNDGNAI
jgi:hypothetical protein